jgi:hypothetical protein
MDIPTAENGTRRTRHVMTRLTDDTYRRLRMTSAEAYQSMGAYVAQLITQALADPQGANDDEK